MSHADALLRAWDDRSFVAPITDRDPDFGLADAYDVLAEIERRRRDAGWRPVGRKIGFTNRTIWPVYGVEQPLWARMWDRTVRLTEGNPATVSLDALVQPRLEPEVVFRLRSPLPAGADVDTVLGAVGSIAAGFELVHCHFEGWRFRLPDCTADFGLHATLVVGQEVELDDDRRRTLVHDLPAFEATLMRDGDLVARGLGADVLDGPAHALAHLADVLAGQPQFEPLAAGEAVTTGTVTDAQPIEPGQTWTCDYGVLDLPPVRLTLA